MNNEEAIICPEHNIYVFPKISKRTGVRYFLCDHNGVEADKHFLKDPHQDDESNWGLRNNFINDPSDNKPKND